MHACAQRLHVGAALGRFNPNQSFLVNPEDIIKCSISDEVCNYLVSDISLLPFREELLMTRSRSIGDDSLDSASQKARSAIAKAASGERSIHPALIPGVSVEDTRANFKTNKTVFAVALAATIAIIVWAIVAPENLASTGTNLQAWVVQHFGWLFTIVMIATTIFLLSIAIAPTGKIKLGSDDSEPDFSRSSWIAMLFAAGLGIGLVFYGPMEPLSHFLTPPPYLSDVEPASEAAVLPAFSQAILHQATLPWMVYALVGGSLAYAAYRRGRLPLISSLFEPIATNSNNRVIGKIVDIFSVLVTLLVQRPR